MLSVSVNKLCFIEKYYYLIIHTVYEIYRWYLVWDILCKLYNKLYVY